MNKLYIVLILLILLIACNEESAQHEKKSPMEHHEESHTQHNPLSGDLQELTAKEELPAFLKEKHETVSAVYKIALEYADVLEWIPCYCGCGESAGHRSSLNCFIAEIREDEVLWDDHGTRCQVCLEIAVESAKRAKDGKSIQEIRTYIDEKYQEGYSTPTPTEMPA
ncbi:PCYCGC motif-containing (lipo)protein [Ureibacillus thermophilus]|uniref:PCYCGC motif-containing (lipo)protein n=1 Tax=Ureibacillus thermophilus TaxID=367743 RepID=UPI003623E130